MMKYEDQLKLQAYIDGELPPGEAREAANRLATDSEAVALLAELRNTRKALAGFEETTELQESREFYWSKIEREIQRLEVKPEPVSIPFSARLRRFLFPAAAFALLVITGLVAVQHIGPTGSSSSQLATASLDPGVITYRDDAQGVTVVWLSYPAEK
jgi:anti-sigma factor RsiW